ncbi:MAG: LpxD N-terminal domain-containing protein, partial [Gemmatimonadaceae bacterium]
MTAVDVRRSTIGGEGPPSLTADDIARLVHGTVQGDGATRIYGVAPLDRAGAAELSFLASAQYTSEFLHSAAGIVLVTPALATLAGGPNCRIAVDRPQEAMLEVLPALYPPPPRREGIHPTVILGRGAVLGRDVAIGPFSV